ncbi:MAG: MYXO-CTERM sorting domain-containing protein [Leifsonia sp.]
MRWSDPRETTDVGIGFVGFFAFAFLVITIVCELTGQPALGWAITLLVLVLALVGLLQRRRRILAQREADEERRAHQDS